MYCPCWYIKLRYIFSSVKYQVAGEDYLVAPISSHQILQWCPKWDSNPQNHDFESRKYTSSIIRAYRIWVLRTTPAASLATFYRFSILWLKPCENFNYPIDY